MFSLAVGPSDSLPAVALSLSLPHTLIHLIMHYHLMCISMQSQRSFSAVPFLSAVFCYRRKKRRFSVIYKGDGVAAQT